MTRTSVKYILLLAITIECAQSSTQTYPVFIDGDFSDWSSDYGGQNLKATSNSNSVFLYFCLAESISLQNSSNLDIRLDTDDDPLTGLNGYEIIWNAGNRSGISYSSDGQPIETDIGYTQLELLSAPTIDSDCFEISLKRSLFSETSTRINVSHSARGNSYNESISFNLNNTQRLVNRSHIAPEHSNVRICSYNVAGFGTEHDGLWEPSLSPLFEAEIDFINPDIIAFQEIYSHDENESLSWAKLVDENFDYSVRQNDCHIVSKSPITNSWPLDGNLAALIQLPGDKQLLLICTHLPCCTSSTGRDFELGTIESFIQDIRLGNISEIDQDIPVSVVGDFNFVYFDSDNIDDFKSLAQLHEVNSLHLTEDANYTWENSAADNYSPGKLDWIFASENLLATNSFTYKGAQPSDHLPLIVDYGLDEDTNGLPDGWEIANFEATGIDANLDSDLDSYSNIIEYISGTNPMSQSDYPSLSISHDSTSGGKPHWKANYSATYRIQKSENLISWTTLDWILKNSNEAFELETDPSQPTGEIFYRMKIE